MKHNKDLVIHAIDGMNNITEGNTYGCDLHSALFNTDYFIIGYYKAEQWLINNVGIFQAIETIREYENNMFGEVSTDFSSSEKVVNMYSYIIGEEILKALLKNWKVCYKNTVHCFANSASSLPTPQHLKRFGVKVVKGSNKVTFKN